MLSVWSVGKEILLAIEVNPVKKAGSDKMVPRLAQTLDGWRKDDGPVMKKLSVEAFIQGVTDLTTIAFYYLLHVGKLHNQGHSQRIKANPSVQTHLFQER